MRMRELVDKYIRNVEQALREMKILEKPKLDENDVKHVVNLARLYLKDSDFYREHGKLRTALASISYCEGLLDALRLLKLVEFKWPGEKGR